MFGIKPLCKLWVGFKKAWVLYQYLELFLTASFSNLAQLKSDDDGDVHPFGKFGAVFIPRDMGAPARSLAAHQIGLHQIT